MGTVLTNGPAIRFVMQSDLVLRANLADIAKPTVTITNLFNGYRLSNAVVTVAGRMTDNGPLAGVLYQHNGGAWQMADGLTNWTAELTLTPGPNEFRAFSEDAAGNRSVTNIVTFTYVVIEPLTVEMNGVGTISPNYIGAPLELGKEYGTRATAGTGYAFSNWTDTAGTVLTNGPAIRFMMESNLVLRANFGDIAKPFLFITNLVNGAKLTNLVLAVAGRVTDNGPLAGVRFQHNDGAWQTASGAEQWTASFNVGAGENTFRAYAEDAAGNCSVTNTVTFTYIGTEPPLNQRLGEVELEFASSNGGLSVSNGMFQMRLLASGNATVVIERSTNLIHWVPIQTNSVTAPGLSLAIPTINHPKQYFRAALR